MNKQEIEDWYAILNWRQRTRHPYIMYELINDIPERLKDTLKEQRDNIREIAKELAKRNVKRIYFVGSGNSFYATFPAKYAIEKIAGIPTVPEEGFELAHYTIPNLSKFDALNYAVVGISLSGGTKACIDALKIASEKGAYTIGITGATGTPMEKHARVIVIPKGVRKDVPVRANTFPAASFVASLLAVTLREELRGKDSVSTKLQEQLEKIPATVQKVINDVESTVIELAKKYVTDEDFYYIGGGPNYGTALDGALMANEMSRARPWAWEVEEMCHGPWSTLRRKSILVIIAPPGPSYHRATMLAHGVKECVGATIISLVRKGDKGEIVKYSDHVIEVPEEVDEVFSPIVYDIPLLLFAYYRAVYGGINPDAHGMDRAGFELLPRIFHPPGWH